MCGSTSTCRFAPSIINMAEISCNLYEISESIKMFQHFQDSRYGKLIQKGSVPRRRVQSRNRLEKMIENVRRRYSIRKIPPLRFLPTSSGRLLFNPSSSVSRTKAKFAISGRRHRWRKSFPRSLQSWKQLFFLFGTGECALLGFSAGGRPLL